MLPEFLEASQLMSLPVVGMLFFIAMFVAVVVWVCGRRRVPHWDRMSRLPLDDALDRSLDSTKEEIR